MSQVAIVTDSACNLPPEPVARYGIEVVPLNLHWGNRSFLDGVDLSADELYQLLRTEPDDLPLSSSPSLGGFLRTYTRLSSKTRTIVSVHIAAGLSATWSVARQAAALVKDVCIEVIDSGSVAMGAGFVALGAARAATEGACLVEAVYQARAMSERVRVYGVLDSLRYVQRSGRLPAIAAIAGSLLHIRPLLYVRNGQAGMLEIQRSKHRALERLLDVVSEQAAGRPIHAAVMHADAAEEAAELQQRLAQRCNCRELFVAEFTPVMGAYAGPGLLGIALYPESG